MRIDFEDGSHIEIRLNGPGKVAVILGAKDRENPLKYVTNACEVTVQEFSDLVNDIPVKLPVSKNALKKIQNTEK